MARKKKGARRYNANAPGNGKKIGPTIKKQGILKGPGVYLAKQTGLKGFKTVAPLFILLMGTAAIWPGAAHRLVAPLAGIPIAGDLAMLAMTSGVRLRAGIPMGPR